MILLSPGLATLLYGVSAIPGEGTVAATKVLLPMIIGVLLISTFVFWSFKPKHPLLDLRLFKNINLTISIITMFLFAAAFFGALLLVPTYFQQVDGDSVRRAGVLLAPQGIGAMLTMPVAGALTDKIPVGRIVPFGFLGILIGLFGLINSTDPGTSDWTIRGWLFVTGLGMGATMMPLFTSALKTLKAADVARGSTLLNVTQQVASATGIATISVVLTNAMKSGDVIAGSEKIKGLDGGVTPAQLAAGSHTPEGAKLVDALNAGGAILHQGLPGPGGRLPVVVLGRVRRPARHADPGRLPAAQAGGRAPARRRGERRAGRHALIDAHTYEGPAGIPAGPSYVRVSPRGAPCGPPPGRSA